MSDITANSLTPAGRRVGVASENTLQGVDVAMTGDLDQSVDDFIVIDSALIEKRPMPVSELATKALDLAYGINQPDFPMKDAKINGNLLVGSDWEVLHYSCDNVATNQYDLKAVAFKNCSTGAIHIACAGTKLFDWYDLQDDLGLIVGYLPSKIAILQQFLDDVLQAAGGDLREVTLSGHSLGGILAEIMAVMAANCGLNVVGVTTVENPGSATIIQSLRDKHLLGGNLSQAGLDALRQLCVVNNGRPNFINTAYPQFAAHCNLVLPPKKVTIEHSATAPEAAPPDEGVSSLWRFGQYLYSAVGTAVGTCASYLGLSHLAQVGEDHGLRNFQDLHQSTVIPVKEWPHGLGSWDGPLLAEAIEEQLLERLRTQPSKGRDVLIEEENYGSFANFNAAGFDEIRCAGAAKNVPSSQSGYREEAAGDSGYDSDSSVCSGRVMVDSARVGKFYTDEPCSVAALRGQYSSFVQSDLTDGSAYSSDRRESQSPGYPSLGSWVVC